MLHCFLIILYRYTLVGMSLIFHRYVHLYYIEVDCILSSIFRLIHFIFFNQKNIWCCFLFLFACLHISYVCYPKRENKKHFGLFSNLFVYFVNLLSVRIDKFNKRLLTLTKSLLTRFVPLFLGSHIGLPPF